MVLGKKPKRKVGSKYQELKVNIPSGYDNVNLIWSSRSRFLQIETDFMNGRAIFLH